MSSLREASVLPKGNKSLVIVRAAGSNLEPLAGPLLTSASITVLIKQEPSESPQPTGLLRSMMQSEDCCEGTVQQTFS